MPFALPGTVEDRTVSVARRRARARRGKGLTDGSSRHEPHRSPRPSKRGAPCALTRAGERRRCAQGGLALLPYCYREVLQEGVWSRSEREQKPR